ncbi:MAG TPA: WD40 repeat domain-containing serine/threonine protein kinase, partial [Polyangia bacterium]
LDSAHQTLDPDDGGGGASTTAPVGADGIVSVERTTPRADGPPLDPVVAEESYALGDEVGRGGLGRVLAAYDRRLGRAVAIKELISRDGNDERRFLREARLTARLQHPSIVPVYEAGHWPNGKPFYAMKLARGRSFADVLAQTPTREQRLALLPTLLATAEAVAYAHDKRIIHRDLKPSNILMGSFGETLVIDWGLARPLDEAPGYEGGPYRHDPAAGQTLPGSVVGTPAYMAPEQARGEVVDERADVYALGAILYELVAGTRPYDGQSSAQLLAQVQAGPPPPLETRAPRVPADLAAIVATAMARDPAQRYANGSALAADLKRFLDGELVRAHRYSRAALVARFIERHRTPVALSALFALVLAAVALFAVARVVHERSRAERERTRAEAERDRARASANDMIVAGARATLDRDPTATLAWLKRYPVDGADWPAARSLALEALGAGAARHVWRQLDGPVFSAQSPDGKRFATQGAGEELEIRELDSGRVVASAAPGAKEYEVLWSGDGRRVVGMRSIAPIVDVWDLGSDRARVLRLPAKVDLGTHALSPDGATLAVGGPHGNVSLIALDGSGADGGVRAVAHYAGSVCALAFSRDGRTLLS